VRRFSLAKQLGWPNLTSIYSVIAGRAIKNEYLSLGVIFSAIGVGLLASRGGDKTDASKPQSLVEKAKASVPLNAGSRYVGVASREIVLALTRGLLFLQRGRAIVCFPVAHFSGCFE